VRAYKQASKQFIFARLFSTRKRKAPIPANILNIKAKILTNHILLFVIVPTTYGSRKPGIVANMS